MGKVIQQGRNNYRLKINLKSPRMDIIEFSIFDYALRQEICQRKETLNRREWHLFKELEIHLNNPNYPKCIPHFSFPIDEHDQREELDHFDQINLLDGLSIEQIESTIVAIANFHAFSLKQMNPVDNAVMPFTRVDQRIEQSVKDFLLEQLIHLSDSGYYFQKNERALRKFFESTNFEASIENSPVMLCHGNLSAENVCFKNEDGKADVLIVNWDLARPGSGLSDLAHLLLTSVETNTLLELLDHWIGLYQTTFEHGLQQNKKGKIGLLKRVGQKRTRLSQAKKQFLQLIPSQLLRALPLLMGQHKKLHECWKFGQDEDEAKEIERKKGAIIARMIGGFELIREAFE